MRCRSSLESWRCSSPKRTCPGCRQSAFVAFLLLAHALQQSLTPPHLLPSPSLPLPPPPPPPIATPTTKPTSFTSTPRKLTEHLGLSLTRSSCSFSFKVAQRDESNGALARMARSAVRLSLTCLTCLARARLLDDSHVAPLSLIARSAVRLALVCYSQLSESGGQRAISRVTHRTTGIASTMPLCCS